MKAIDLVYKLCEHQISLGLSDLKSIDKNAEETPSKESIQELVRMVTENSLIEVSQEHLIIIQGEKPIQPGQPDQPSPLMQLDTEINSGAWAYTSSGGCHMFLWLKEIAVAKEFIKRTELRKHPFTWLGTIDTESGIIEIKAAGRV